MGMNTAGASGVLANIQAESNFSPTAGSSNYSYGICQWTGSRLSAMKSYCNRNGYSWNSLYGQLYYLRYELTNSYPKTYNYVRSVNNTSNGAYDAGYYWCYYFEIPSDRGNRAVTRGNAARNTYFPKYRYYTVEQPNGDVVQASESKETHEQSAYVKWFNYTGLVKTNVGTYYVKNGVVQTAYNGKLKIDGKTYTIRNGRVVG